MCTALSQPVEVSIDWSCWLFGLVSVTSVREGRELRGMMRVERWWERSPPSSVMSVEEPLLE